jgi:L1 cell adhesion molecule like protein
MKNKLESYIYNWRNQMDNAEITAKLSEDDITTIKKNVKETQDWLDTNTTATHEEFEAKLKECEGVFNEFSTKLYSGGSDTKNNVSSPSMKDDEIEEVD